MYTLYFTYILIGFHKKPLCMIIIYPEKLAYFPFYWCMYFLVLGVSLVGLGGVDPNVIVGCLLNLMYFPNLELSWHNQSHSFGDHGLTKHVLLFLSLISVYLELHLKRLIKTKAFLALDILRKLLKRDEGICIFI